MVGVELVRLLAVPQSLPVLFTVLRPKISIIGMPLMTTCVLSRRAWTVSTTTRHKLNSSRRNENADLQTVLIELIVNGTTAAGWLDGVSLFADADVSASAASLHGFPAIGLGGYYHAQFNDFSVKAA